MNNLWIIIQREFFTRIAKKGYWIFTAIGLVVMVGLSFLPAITNYLDTHTRTKVILNDPKHIVSAAMERDVKQNAEAYNITLISSADATVSTMTEDRLKSYMAGLNSKTLVIVQGDSAASASFQIEQNGTLSPSTLSRLKTLFQSHVFQARVAALGASAAQTLSAPVDVQVHQLQVNSKSSDQLFQSQMLVYFMEMLLMFTLMFYGVWVAQGIIEEKSNRIIEMMLIAVKPWQILFGKVLGVGFAALMQYAVWTVSVVVALLLRNQISSIELQSIPVVTIVMLPVFFVLGYLLYAILFAIGGSLVHRAEEQQMAVAPISILMVLAFYSSMFVFTHPDSTTAVVFSFIPFLAPLSMFARVALGDVPVWQVSLSVAMLLVCIWIAIRSGAKIYHRFALRTSGKTGWKLLVSRHKEAR